MSARAIVLGLSIALLGVSPAPALAQGQGTARGGLTQHDASTPSSLTLRVHHLRRGAALIFSRVTISGTLAPFSAGDQVELSYYRDGTLIAQRAVNVSPAADGAGAFSDRFPVTRDGRYGVSASFAANGAQGGGSTPRVPFGVYFPWLHQGSHGRISRAFKRELRRMGYDAGGGAAFNQRTAREVLAYRKVNDFARNSQASPAIVRRVLDGQGGFHVRYPGAGDHAEVSLSKQVLVLTRGARPYSIYPVSTGKPSTPTVQGHFNFYLRSPGYNSEGMYYSFYFIRGYAVHGYASVPNYPASHGCVRTYLADQPHIYYQLRYGESIFVY